jgi:hypothetical protein
MTIVDGGNRWSTSPIYAMNYPSGRARLGVGCGRNATLTYNLPQREHASWFLRIRKWGGYFDHLKRSTVQYQESGAPPCSSVVPA